MQSLNINCETGEETFVNLSSKEIDEVYARESVLIAEQAKLKQNLLDKEALLAKLGITAVEAKILLS